METDTQKRMQKTIDALRVEFNKMRTGHAHSGMLDTIMVSCYGSELPLSQTATITAVDSRTLMVSPWDANNTTAIEKSIRDSDLGVNPAITGNEIRVGLPVFSEERRLELVKVINRESESARVSVRNIRRDIITEIKAKVKSGDHSEDEGRRYEQSIQKVTDSSVNAIDSLAEEKKQELMTV